MRTFSFSLITTLVLFAAQSAFAATVPQIASAMGRELDRQVVEHTGQADSPARNVSLVVLTPVNINDLEKSNPLARQVQEELARWFVQAGYQVREARKGADILFEPRTGEMLLTRRTDLLGTDVVGSSALLTGTYTVTPSSVRFNIRMVMTGSQEVVAMSTMTVNINTEVAALLHSPDSPDGRPGTPIQPTVVTLLP